MVLKKQERTASTVQLAHLAKLAGLAKCLAERVNPARRTSTRKALPKAKAALAQGGDPGAERKRGNPHILDFCVCLFEATSRSQTRNPTCSTGAAEFFFFDGRNDGVLVHQYDRGVAAEGPDAEGKHRFSVPRFPRSFEAKRAPNQSETCPVKKVPSQPLGSTYSH